MRTYTELIKLKTFEERFDYLSTRSKIGDITFGYDRIFNQRFYRSAEWRRLRNDIIIRDSGCDLAILDRPIYGRIIIHHLNPFKLNDMDNMELLLDPEFLVCVSHDTHNALHYGDSKMLSRQIADREPNDTCPWRKS